ncbi:MAG: serine/threonine-protein kinase [Gemmatimonadetes bacterium]|nr:serine/threonine-protein kinase [Gemmatimonadota bacterium]
MTTVPDRLATALADRYRIERELGQGGMATVYLAEDLKHRRRVALKVLKPELAAVLGAERFVQEITTTAALQHPHILPLFDSGTAEGFLFYVMPFIDGETLRGKLDRETQLGIEEAVRITTAVADALDYAHRHGVIHRDIKPENILLHEGRPMVADFGIALAVSAAAGGRMTETGLSLGTPHYMSPEQATAAKEISARSDVYSLASVLYEMLAGDPPHVGASAQQIIMKIVTEEPAPVTRQRRNVPPNVAAAVARALEKLPADRFESAKAFADALGDTGFTHAAVSTPPSAFARGASRLRDPVFAAVALVAVAAVAVAAWAVRGGGASEAVSRYSIRLPEGLQPTGPFARIAITPDGRTMVFTGGRAGEWELYARDRSELTATKIPGTFGGFAPFLSPTGDRVAFTTVNGLGIAALDGRDARRLTDTVRLAVAGGSWATDGRIYVGANSRGIRWLDAEGSGISVPFTTVDRTRGESQHTFPDALPNGKGVLFTISRAEKGEEFKEIAVARTDDGSHTALVRGVYARYVASGHLLYATIDGTLWAQAFDQDRLALTGRPARVLDSLGLRTIDAPDLAISSEGTLLYSTGGPRWDSESVPVWVGRDGSATDVDPDRTHRSRGVALSPNGARLAFEVVRTTNAPDLWVRELAAGTKERLTSQGLAFNPAWMPNGQDLLYVGSHDGIGRLRVYRHRVGTRDARVLVEHPEGIFEVEVARDSSWIVYRAGTDGATGDLYARRLHGDTTSIAIAATEAREVAPALSPDGRWLAFVSTETGAAEVYVQRFPDGGRRWPVSTRGGIEPLWSRDGRELFYRSGANEMVAVTIDRAATPPTGAQRVLFAAGAFARNGDHRTYDVTPDGRRFVMTQLLPGQREEDFRLVVVENFFAELRRSVQR